MDFFLNCVNYEKKLEMLTTWRKEEKKHNMSQCIDVQIYDSFNQIYMIFLSYIVSHERTMACYFNVEFEEFNQQKAYFSFHISFVNSFY